MHVLVYSRFMQNYIVWKTNQHQAECMPPFKLYVGDKLNLQLSVEYKPEGVQSPSLRCNKRQSC